MAGGCPTEVQLPRLTHATATDNASFVRRSSGNPSRDRVMTRFMPPVAGRWRSGLSVIVLAVLACDGPTGPSRVPLAERDLLVRPTGVALSGAGATARFTLVDSTGASVPADSVSWFSLAPAIATVDSAMGLATAVSAGQAVIGARIGTTVVDHGHRRHASKLDVGFSLRAASIG
jgi:hypothetical protein